MQSLLIVEDEKLIRQGIRTMAERSGVPIENIYEANNGEAALAILREQAIEVMFTDIRMPRMDGIELVHETQKLPHPPYVVAISGFDEFTYAVEMLRSGATEYLLKPIEREKIREILTELDLRLREQADATDGDAYENILLNQAYRCALFSENALKAGHGMVMIPGVTGGEGVLVPDQEVPSLLENFSAQAAGLSSMHRGREELKTALKEAQEARRIAFCQEKCVTFDAPKKEIPEKLAQHAGALLTETKRTHRLQIVGTKSQKELISVWGSLFEETRRGHLPPGDFFEEIRTSLPQIRKIYRQVISEEENEKSKELDAPLMFTSLSDYEEEFLNLLVGINAKLMKADEEEPSQKKMTQAIAYIREHYAEDINMATVSNYVSMNYTLFSYSFKQYMGGQNFVTYLREVRMKAARELLENTDDKIIDIAHQVGYDNEKHFLKTFKSEFGVSPSEYRKNMQRASS